MIGRNSRNIFVFGVTAAIVTAMLGGGALAADPDPNALLSEMSAEIAKLDSYEINGDAYADARLAAGLIIENPSQVRLRLRKPGTLRLTNTDTEDMKEIFFNDGVLTVYSQRENFYAQTEIPEGIESAVTFAMDEIGIDAPLLDFVSTNVSDNLLQAAGDVRYLGTSLIRGKVHHQIALRGPEVDMQIWISADGPPLPGKVVMTSKWEGGSPRFVAFLNWDTSPSIPTDSVRFEPPEGATKIEFLLDSQD